MNKNYITNVMISKGNNKGNNNPARRKTNWSF